MIYQSFFTCTVGSDSAASSDFNWMPAPQAAVPDCPAGLEYLVQIDRLLVSKFLEGILLPGHFMLTQVVSSQPELTGFETHKDNSGGCRI